MLCSRSCKRREILFQKSLLLFSTWRVLLQPAYSLLQPAKKSQDLNKVLLLLQDLGHTTMESQALFSVGFYLIQKLTTNFYVSEANHPIKKIPHWRLKGPFFGKIQGKKRTQNLKNLHFWHFCKFYLVNEFYISPGPQKGTLLVGFIRGPKIRQGLFY